MRSIKLIALGLLVGCGENPTTDALVGTWLNGDDGVAREAVFVDDGSYVLHVDDETVQAGTYEVADHTLVTLDGNEREMNDVLVWTVLTDANDAFEPGTQFGDPIYRFTGDLMVLHSGSTETGRRIWEIVP